MLLGGFKDQMNIEIMIKMREEGHTYVSIGRKFGISRQRVHQLITGYRSPASIIPVEELQTWTKRKQLKYPKEWEEFKLKHPRAIAPEDLKVWNERKRKYLGLPTENIHTSGGGREFIREIVRIRDNHTCQRCKKTWIKGQRKFDVHHLDEEMLGKNRVKGVISYDKENMNKLITFCHKCHYGWHKEMGHTKLWKRGSSLTSK